MLNKADPMKRSLTVLVLFGLLSTANAQNNSNYYNQNGQGQGRAVQQGDTTNYYNQNGQSQGRTCCKLFHFNPLWFRSAFNVGT